MKRETIFDILVWLYSKLTHVTIINEDVLPKEGPFILAVNHMSRLDFPALLNITRRYDLFGFVADKYKKYPIFDFISRSTNMVYIDRTNADFAALKTALQLIKSGKVFCLSPEGTRSKTGQLLEAKSGIVLLASKSGVPVCTGSITGTENFMKQFLRLRKPRITIYFSPPYMMEKIDPDHREESLQKITDDVMCRIAAMLPESYRGYYKDYPEVQAHVETWQKDARLTLP